MSTNENQKEPFPWHLGVYDAHCHPTDTMSSMETLRTMKARALTVMATRIEDQDLVLAAAEKHGVQSPDPSHWTTEECIVACFGWHPWFSHQMYIPGENEAPSDAQHHGKLTEESKIKHYQSVLQPVRPDLSEQDRQLFLSLPDPISFSSFLSKTRQQLQCHPYALIGEIGLDRAFRIPEPWPLRPDLWKSRNSNLTPGGREGRRLTPFRCSPQHQRSLFQRQLQLAGELGRAVSVHGVQAHGMLLETMQELWKGHEKATPSKRERKKKHGPDHPSTPHDLPPETKQDAKPTPYPPRICLHSYSGNASNWKQYLHPAIPARIFASFSTAINLSDALGGDVPASLEEVVRTVPDHRLLVESDLDRAGEDIDTRLEDIVRKLCRIKGWELEEGVMRLGSNWRAFVFGDEDG